MRCGTLLEETGDGIRDRRARATPLSVDFEDETVMNSGSTEPTPRSRSDDPPAIADVGFNKRIADDREETPVSSLSEPWEKIVDATSRPAMKRRVPQAPPTQKRASSLPPRKSVKAPSMSYDKSLDADTDEGVVQVPPDPDEFAALQPMKKRTRTEAPPPAKKPVTSDLPSFGSDSPSWPSGSTKPVASPLKRLPEKKRSDLLENKPVTGAKPPPSRPAREQAGFGGQTIAAPGELAGIVDQLPPASRPELVDDLMSPAALRNQEREHRRAEMRKSVETTSPEELRRARRSPQPSEPISLEDTRDVLPPHRLEETRAFTENPLSRSLRAPISDLMPLPVEASRKADARPFGQTQVVLRLASGRRRLLALWIDAMVVGVIVMVPGLLGLFGEEFSTANWLDPDDVSLLLMKGNLTLPLIALALLTVIFSASSHGLMGRSLGKLICGLELVRKKTGERVTFLRSVVRALLSLFSVIFGGAGYLWLIVDRRARTLHDYLTGTVVVVASSRSESRTEESFVQEPTL